MVGYFWMLVASLVIRVRLAKRFYLRLLCNSCIEVFGYKSAVIFYMWALPLSALQTLFCWSWNFMLLVAFLPLASRYSTVTIPMRGRNAIYIFILGMPLTWGVLHLVNCAENTPLPTFGSSYRHIWCTHKKKKHHKPKTINWRKIMKQQIGLNLKRFIIRMLQQMNSVACCFGRTGSGQIGPVQSSKYIEPDPIQ